MNPRAAIKRSADDRGTVVFMVAVMFIIVIGFTALVTDIGALYVARSGLQGAVDAGALAGCQQFIQSPSQPDAAVDVARQTVVSNASGQMSGLTATAVDASTGNAGGRPLVSVAVTRTVPAFFARLLGQPTFSVSAQARAEAQRLSGVRYVAPYALVVPGTIRGVRYRVTEATSGVEVANGSLPLVDAASRMYSASIPSPAYPGRFDVWIEYQNTANVWEGLYDCGYNYKRAVPACMLFTRGAGQPVQSVSPDRSLFVEWTNSSGVSWPVINARVSNRDWYLAPSVLLSNLTPNFWATEPVMVGTTRVAYLHARRPDAVIADVSVAPVVADPGALVQLSVVLTGTSFQQTSWTAPGGAPRSLRLQGQPALIGLQAPAYSGDYVELDLAALSHGACGAQPFDTTGIPGLNANAWRQFGYPAPVHINDTVAVRPTVGGGLPYFTGVPSASGAAIPAIAPVVVRIGGNQVRVVDFVPVSVSGDEVYGYTYEIRAGSYATPHQFTSVAFSGAGSVGRNGVRAARLVP